LTFKILTCFNAIIENYQSAISTIFEKHPDLPQNYLIAQCNNLITLEEQLEEMLEIITYQNEEEINTYFNRRVIY